jgi:predicted Zn-dependent peptidase
MDIALNVFRDAQKTGITKSELELAKSKLGSRIVRGSERPMGRMQALGFYWTYLKKYHSVDDDLKAIDAVSLKTVRKVLDEYPLDHLTIVALGPLDAVSWNAGSDEKKPAKHKAKSAAKRK